MKTKHYEWNYKKWDQRKRKSTVTWLEQKANAQIFIYEDITKLRQLNEKVTKEKSKLVEQLMKNTGATDSIECKLDKATENLENKVTSEIHDFFLKKLFMKELGDVKVSCSFVAPKVVHGVLS